MNPSNKHFIKINLLLLALVSLVFVSARPEPAKYVKIKTQKGACIIRLYDETPKHRDNFIKLVQSKAYDSLLFHRVIKNFMIQGGDPESKHATKTQLLGDGEAGEKISAEFVPGIIHRKGALAAARDDNVEKASSGIQFYLVQGKIFTNSGLDSLEAMRHIKLTAQQRLTYTTLGGVPHLDNQYTVFGSIVEGISMVDSIASLQVDLHNRPLTDIRMEMTMLAKRDVRQLKRRLKRKNDGLR